MSLEEIEKRILAEAEAQAAKIKKEGEEQAKRIEQEAALKISALREGILSEARLKAEGVKRNLLTPVRLRAKMELLTKKREILEQVYSEALREHPAASKNIHSLKRFKEETEAGLAQILFE